ncbi:phosphonoacetaldehyde hydrolase [Desulfovibrio aerotolerans]|uniref:phosphonoacetaldehyde hydrolase n=1 Tax=Solidesulfovibrio aerotolerans TaxID=295255 RepID=A0A7C9IUT7_9BACT|nr:phosphonoacetaldehyde hydrolase [Solidesulfovibrio aerotolerans]MYL81962.1 phosphonoacetaldehyde hydrolase [Solidesulfovibrio aerotolerans]
MAAYIRRGVYTGPVLGLVLDWAGTAVDYGCIGPVAVFLEVFTRRGVVPRIEEARAPMGLMKKDHIRAMCAIPALAARWTAVHGRAPDEDDVDAMYRETEPLMVACIANHAELIPGLLDAVAAFRRMGLRLGSTTGYTGPMMDVLRPAAAAQGYVPDAVCCSTDVPAGRPYPWMCYRNAIDLGVYPMEALVKVGDTISDIEEGLNAGMWTVALSKSGNELGLPLADVHSLDPSDLAARLAAIEARLLAAGAHYVVKDITEVPQVIGAINDRLARGEQPVG